MAYTPMPPLLLGHFTCRQLCFFFSQAKYPNSVFFSPATLLHHLRTHPLLLLLPLTSQFSLLPRAESELNKILSSHGVVQLSKQAIWFRSHPHLATQRMFVRTCSVVPTITNIVNLSLTSGQFHPTLKESVISPLLKKPALDRGTLYRPISNLSLISKIIESVVKSSLMDHLTFNNLLHSLQSAYCKHHSTETALLCIHDQLISAIESQKYHVFAYSTSLLLLTLLTMTSWSPVSHPGLVSMALFFACILLL